MVQRAERLERLLGNLPAFLLLVFILATFTVLLGNANILSLYFGQFPETGVLDLGKRVEVAPLKGIELLLIPLTAYVVARWSVGSDRFRRWARDIGPMRPILFFATMLAVLVYFLFSVQEPMVSFGPDHFGVPRWFGALLLVLFTWLWQPLFPRTIANLAAMVVGPTAIAVFGYAFFDSYARYFYYEACDGCELRGVLLAILVMLVEAPLLFISSPRAHAIWTGTVMTCTALFGLAWLSAWVSA